MTKQGTGKFWSRFRPTGRPPAKKAEEEEPQTAREKTAELSEEDLDAVAGGSGGTRTIPGAFPKKGQQ